MNNSIIKDKNRRNRFKKAEIKNLQNKSIFQDQILFKNFVKLLSKNNFNEIFADLFSKIDTIPSLTHEQIYERNIDLQKDKINKLYLFWLQKNLKSSIGKSNQKNCSITRIKNRCIESGRARSILRFCRLSRIVLRDKASRGLIPGASKASW